MLGGGVQLAGANSGFDLSVGATAIFGGATDHWDGSGNNESGSAAQMTTYAICADDPTLRYVAVDGAIPANSVGDLNNDRAHCPRGTQLTGGGVVTTGNSADVRVIDSEPFDSQDANNRPDDGWFGRAFNGTTTDKRVRVLAVCARSGHYRYVTSQSQPLPPHSQRSEIARCPAGTKLTGGGAAPFLDLEQAAVESTFPLDFNNDDDSAPDDGWQGIVNNDSATATRVHAFAICNVPATRLFSGSFNEGGTVSFKLTHNGNKIERWTWHHLPVSCREGSEENSGHYGFKITVHNHNFKAVGVRDPNEHFLTTLHGTLTDHNKAANGTFSMVGPEPPLSTHCHGTGRWSAVIQ